MHHVTVAAELGDVRQAAEVGQAIDVRGLPRERQVRHHLEVARALSRIAQRDEALAAVLAAEQSAPEQVRRHFLTHELVHHWIRDTRRRPSRELVDLSQRLGHSSLTTLNHRSTTPPMATPRMAAGVLFRDHTGRVLLVKPTYKAGWDIPGGYVEPGESPKQAAQREVREELGIEPAIGRLLVVDWAPHPTEGAKALFIFDGGQLNTSNGLSGSAPDEIEEVRFWSDADLPAAPPPRLRDRIASALRMHGGDSYLEHGLLPHLPTAP